MQENSFAGRVAVVTGATRGIGLAVARSFVAHGCRVVAVGRSIRSGTPVSEWFDAHADDVEVALADLTAPEDVESIARCTIARFGRVDFLVNNAGIVSGKPLLEASVEHWDHVVNTNLRAPFLLSRALVPHMIRGGGGCIVNVSSVLAVAALPGSGAYSASKAGLLGLTQAMAVEWSALGIRANCVLPGSTETEMMWHGLSADQVAEERRRVSDTIPVGRLASPTEISDVCLWLCSPSSTYLSGSAVLVDGGALSRFTGPR